MKKILCFLMISVALFGNTDSINKEATKLLNEGKNSEAMKILEKLYEKGKYNDQTLFLLGVSASKSGDNTLAISYFQELLASNPSLHRVRLEMAVVYFNNRENDKAKEQLLKVKESNPPEEVLKKIDILLAAIDKAPAKNWNARVGYGFMHDTNVNAGPIQNQVEMFNQAFFLNQDAKKRSDNAQVASVSFNILEPLNNSMALQGGVSVSNTDYLDEHDFDTLNTLLSVGPTFKISNAVLDIPFEYSYLILGHDKKYFSYTSALAPKLTVGITNNLIAMIESRYLKKHFYMNSNNDSKITQLDPSLRYFLNKNLFIQAGADFAQEESENDILSNKSRGINTSAYWGVTPSLNLFAQASYSLSRYYKEQDTPFDDKRRDVITNAFINVSYNIKPIEVDLIFSASYTDNNSNIDLYEYRRRQYSISVSKGF